MQFQEAANLNQGKANSKRIRKFCNLIVAKLKLLMPITITRKEARASETNNNSRFIQSILEKQSCNFNWTILRLQNIQYPISHRSSYDILAEDHNTPKSKHLVQINVWQRHRSEELNQKRRQTKKKGRKWSRSRQSYINHWNNKEAEW